MMKTKKMTKLVTLLLALAMVFSLAACSSGKGKDKADGSTDIAALIATEPNSADEASKLYQQLMQKENDILAANSDLWNKVFLSANKNSTMIEDGTNYGDFLLATAYGQPFAVSTAALLPCFQIYYEVGRHLYGIAAPSNPYQAWIDTYRDEAFGDAVRAVLRHTDDAFAAATAADRDAMRAAYLRAARYEWMFWDSAYRLEAWPDLMSHGPASIGRGPA